MVGERMLTHNAARKEVIAARGSTLRCVEAMEFIKTQDQMEQDNLLKRAVHVALWRAFTSFKIIDEVERWKAQFKTATHGGAVKADSRFKFLCLCGGPRLGKT